MDNWMRKKARLLLLYKVLSIGIIELLFGYLTGTFFFNKKTIILKLKKLRT